jgi:O-antigen/teichoic acid export membrane protein
MSSVNRYEKLAGNTVIFAIGSFSAKLMVFLLMPLYTRVLTTHDYGVMDLVVNTANLLTPLVTLSIHEAVIRFGMDKGASRREVLSIGVSTVLSGFTLFLLFIPAFLHFEMISPYTALLYLYVLAAALKSVFAQFVRAAGLVKLYVFDGLMSTGTVILFNVVLLVVFRLGVYGYVTSIIVSNLISVVFLYFAARLRPFVKLSGISRRTRRAMVRYAVPLIPTSIFWWVTNVSDRYMVTYFCGAEINGLYAAAYKIPAMLTVMTAIFYQAWQISAVSEYGQGESTTRFYTHIFASYTGVLFMAGSGLLLLVKPIMWVLVSPSFYSAWEYTPFLVVGEIFSAMVTFLGTFYMAARKSAMVPVAISVGALSNIALNLVLIPRFGAQGAAYATMLCYILAFAVRIVDVRRLVTLDTAPLRMAFSVLCLVLQAAVLMLEVRYQALIQLLLALGVFALNRKALLAIIARALAKVGLLTVPDRTD